MCEFKIGQLVRVVAAEFRTECVGRAAVVTQLEDWGPFGMFYGLDISPIECFQGERRAWRAYQLEPLVDDGHRASEFSFTELMDRCREGVSA